MNNHRPTGIRADAASCGTGAGAGTPGQALGDAAVRRRLREALKRELAAATAAGDEAARRRLLASLQSAITR
jgi:hypothetical protein